MLGTAGIRDLDNRKRSKLVAEIKRFVKKAGFKVDTSSSDCGDISGRDEALYGWLAANYLRGHFTEGVESRGYLEMGGASAQIAFWPMRGEVEWEGGCYNGPLTKMRIGPRNYYVYTKSDGLGAEKAWRHHEAQILTLIDEMEDPCLPSGYSWSTEDKTIKGTRTVRGALKSAVMYKLSDPESPVFIKDKAARKLAEKISESVSELVAPEIIKFIDEMEAGGIDTKQIGQAIADQTTTQTTEAISGSVTSITSQVDEISSIDLVGDLVDEAISDAITAMIEKGDRDILVSKYSRCEATTFQMLGYLSRTAPIPPGYPSSHDAECKPVNLLPDGPRIAHKDHKFLAGAQFWYTTREIFGMDSEGEPKRTDYDYHEFRAEVKALAEMEWADIKLEMPTVAESYLSKALFLAAWITNVLKAYGFLHDEKKEECEKASPVALEPFNGRRENGEDELTWTLGRILLHSVGCKPVEVDMKDIPIDELPIKQC